MVKLLAISLLHFEIWHLKLDIFLSDVFFKFSERIKSTTEREAILHFIPLPNLFDDCCRRASNRFDANENGCCQRNVFHRVACNDA